MDTIEHGMTMEVYGREKLTRKKFVEKILWIIYRYVSYLKISYFYEIVDKLNWLIFFWIFMLEGSRPNNWRDGLVQISLR